MPQDDIFLPDSQSDLIPPDKNQDLAIFLQSRGLNYRIVKIERKEDVSPPGWVVTHIV
jgi:hypothetical protein